MCGLVVSKGIMSLLDLLIIYHLASSVGGVIDCHMHELISLTQFINTLIITFYTVPFMLAIPICALSGDYPSPTRARSVCEV